MAEIIPFRPRPKVADDIPDIDLLSAVDIAIRDLRDIAQRWCPETSPRIAEDCRRMLERALSAAT